MVDMQRYAPIFSQIVDSSLWEEPPHVRILFITLLVLQDHDHIVRVQDHHLRRMANLSDDEVLESLRVLSSPDTRSKIPQPFDGRRIERVEGGWKILNGEKYQTAMMLLNKRSKWAAKKRAQRSRRSLPSNGPVSVAEEIFDRNFDPGKSR